MGFCSFKASRVIDPFSCLCVLLGSTSSSVSDHWLVRLTGDSKRGSVVSRCSTTQPSSIPDSPESPVFMDNSPKEERGMESCSELSLVISMVKLNVYLLILLLGGFESRPFIRGLQGRSLSMRVPSKPKDTLNKVLPLRWSLGSKDRRKHDPVAPAVKEPGPAELVQYLESGRRPRCTKDSIVTLMSEPRGTRDVPEGQASSASVQASGSASCEIKPRVESPQVPEGQRRPSEKTTSSRGGKASQTKDESSTTVSSSSGGSTLTRRKEGRKQSLPDKETSRSASAGVQPSSSTPSLGDGTLRRQKGERAEREHHSSHEGKSKTKKGEFPKSHEGLFSFFKGKIKKEKQPQKPREGDFSEEETSRTLSRLSLSNGSAMRGTGAKEGRSSVSDQRRSDEMANGKVPQRPVVIKRSQSSSNIPTKTEHSVHRTASLHRNGMSAGPPRGLTADKPSSSTLQRTRYSTTSLGRKRNVPESSF